MFLLSLFISFNLILSPVNPSYEKLKTIFLSEIDYLSKLEKAKNDINSAKESILLLKAERLELLKKRDSEYLHLAGLKKAIKKYKNKLRKILEILYKIEGNRKKYFVSPFNGRAVSNKGSDVIIKLLKDQYSIVKKLQNNIASIKQDRQNLTKNIKQSEKVINYLQQKILSLETTIARSNFQIKMFEKRRLKYPKALYDKYLWDLWGKVKTLQRKTRVKNFYMLKGVLARPVVGSYLRSLYNNKGVYISAKVNSFVKAPEAGIIKFIGKISGYGLVIIIEHRNSYFSLIGGLSEPLVQNGQKVKRSQKIARVAPLGKLKFVAVYYELRKGDKYLNPVIWLSKY